MQIRRAIKIIVAPPLFKFRYVWFMSVMICWYGKSNINYDEYDLQFTDGWYGNKKSGCWFATGFSFQFRGIRASSLDEYCPDEMIGSDDQDSI
jgi:hypothetical protein